MERLLISWLNPVLLPGVEVSEGAVVVAGAVVPNNTAIAPGNGSLGIAAEKAVQCTEAAG